MFSRHHRSSQTRASTLKHAVASLFETLEDRRLLSTTVSVTANVADQAVKSDGSFIWIGQKSNRIGDNGTNTTEQAYVMPFQLPAIPSGQSLTSASFTSYLESIGNASSVSGGMDVYGLGWRSAAGIQAGDYFEGAYGTDATDATAIQQSLVINTSSAGTKTVNNTGLLNYLNAQYAAGASAGDYVFLRFNAQSDQLSSRFWVFSSAEATTTSQRPVVNFTFTSALTAPTNLNAVTSGNSEVRLSWTDTNTSESGYRIERSTNGVTFSFVTTTAANATSYTNTGLSAETNHTYRVRADSGGSSSNWSATDSTTTLPVFTNTIWVDSSYAGSTQNGGFSTPYTSIATGLFVANAGDGVVTRGGTYTESVTLKSGTTSARLTLMGNPGERSEISGFSNISGWTLHSGSTYKTTLNYSPKELYVGSTPMPLSLSPNDGTWTAPTATTTTITDAANLAGIPSLVGGYVQVHINAGNHWSGKQITTHNTSTGQITFAAISGFASGDRYMVKNTLNLLDQPGEWASVASGTGTWTVYFRPNNTADLNTTRAPLTTGRQVRLNNVHDVNVRGFEIAGNLGYGIEVGGNAYNFTLQDNIVHHNKTGIWVRYANNFTVKGNVVLANQSNGINLASVNAGLVDGNESAYNTVDSMVVAGDISGKVPGDVGFTPSYDITVSNNYFHHQLGYGHTDGIQLYRWVSDVHLMNNVIQHVTQGVMTEQVDGAELGGNLILNSASFNVRYDHSNSNNWDTHNNTIANGGYGPYIVNGFGYAMNENVTIGRVNIPSITGSQYTGDHNFYTPTTVGGNILRTSTPSKNYTTTAAFYADTGQDQNSNYGDALFINAPVFNTIIDRISEATTNSIYVKDTTTFTVGDHIEFNGDGVVRTLTAVDTTNKKLTFDVAMPGLPRTYLIVENWKASTNFVYDYRPAAGSAVLTTGPGGTQVGSTIHWAAYRDGDFNDDGKRDLPALAADISGSLPNAVVWQPPAF